MSNNQGLRISRQSLGLSISDAIAMFKAIRSVVAKGGDINHTNAEGYTYLTDWITRLYGEIDDQTIDDDNDDDLWESFVRPWFKASLEERGLLPMLDWFFEAGIDPNGDQLISRFENDDLWTCSALEFAVETLDFPMTEYLLQHGADPNKRIGISDQTGQHPDDPEDYYMEDLDIKLESAEGERAQICVDIAKLLLQYGQIYHGGFCIEMSEDGKEIVSVHRMRMRY